MVKNHKQFWILLFAFVILIAAVFFFMGSKTSGTNPLSEGTSCRYDSECLTGECERGICVEPSEHEEVITGIAQKLAQGEPCVINEDCISGYCGDYLCAEGGTEDIDTGSINLFSVYEKPLFEKILPDTKVTTGEKLETLSIKATPGEFEPATFVVLADKGYNVKDLTITSSPFTETNIQPDVDIRVVKTWLQAGEDVYITPDFNIQTDAVLVPELLVYDDSEQLAGGFLPVIEFTDGRKGDAVHLTETGISFSTKNNIDTREGTIELYFKPDWDPSTLDKDKTLFYLPLSSSEDARIKLWHRRGQHFAFYYDDGPNNRICRFSDTLIQKGVWHQIIATWNVETQETMLYLDGDSSQTICEDDPFTARPAKDNKFYLGYIGNAFSAIDQLKIYSYAASEEDITKYMIKNNNLLFSEEFDSQSEIESHGGIFLNRTTYLDPKISTKLLTQVPGSTLKQFWVTVEVPENMPEGTYESTLTISAANSLPLQIPFELTVYPIKLSDPEKLYMADYGQLIETRPVHGEMLKKELMNLKDHGFEGLYINGNRDRLREVLEYTKILNFKGPMIISIEELDEKIELLEKYDYEYYVYGIDEPNFLNQETAELSLRHHITKSYFLHEEDMKVASSIWKVTQERLKNPDSEVYDQVDPATQPNDKTFREEGITYEKLDFANYAAHYFTRPGDNKSTHQSLWDYVKELRDDLTEKDSIPETYYWYASTEFPKYDRVMNGFFLWTSELDGVMPLGHSVLLGDPYIDWDTNSNTSDYRFKDLLAYYPSAQGPIPTLGWEAMREGYDDLRYLTTLQELLEKLKEKDPAKAEEIEDEVNYDLRKYFDPAEHSTLKGEDFQDSRQLIVDMIIQTQELLAE